ncbi:MAG: hypothetical protein S4CHLAM2_06440 [Chlamydiales bacterium]|nr:hypothetical protein [Chlamydiales bacterium]
MVSVDSAGDSGSVERPLPLIRGGVSPRASSTTLKVADVAIPLIFFIAVPAVLGVAMHCHVLAIPIGLELVAASYVTGTVLGNVKKETKKLRQEEHYEKLMPELQKVMNGEHQSVSMQALDAILKALPKKSDVFFERFSEVAEKRKEVKEPTTTYTDYNTTFETARAPSSLFDLGFPEPPKGRIGIVNGILNGFPQAYKNALRVSHLVGGYNVHGVHNATHGVISDLKECRMGLEGTCTAPVWHLHEMWDDFFKDHQNDDQKFIMISHSQGALHTFNALRTYDPELRQRIHVVVVAGAAHIPDHICGSAVHLVSRDPVPRLGLGSGKTVEVTHLTAEGVNSHSFSQPMYYEPLQAKLTELLA